MRLCCFHRIRGPFKSFRVGLGAYPWRTKTDATDLDIYRSSQPLDTDLRRSLLLTLLWHKDDAENVSKHDLWSSPLFFSKTNCGQKKTGSWTQKGKRSHRIFFIILNSSSYVLLLMQWMNTKYYLLFSDYETSDGKTKARSYQRQLEPFEKPHPSTHRQRCKLLYTFLYMYKTLFTYTKVKSTFMLICLTFAFYHFLQKTRYSKLEKADILEMTVRFLSDIPPVNTKGELWFCF